MLVTGVWNIEWSSANTQRRYPLAQNTTAKDITASFNLPDALIAGLCLPVAVDPTLDRDPTRFLISKLASYNNGVLIEVGYQDADDEIITVAIAQATRSTHQKYKSYTLSGVGDFADSIGYVTLGELECLDSEPFGVFSFLIEGSALDPDVIRPRLRSIGRAYVVNSSGTRLGPITGDLVFEAGDNAKIEWDGSSPARIKVSAIDCTDIAEDCGCADTSGAGYIKTINQVSPDGDGNIELVSQSGCMTITPGTHEVSFDNTCSTPCADCKDTAALTNALLAIQNKIRTIEQMSSNLSASVLQTQNVILGSRLGDNACP